MSTVPVVRIDHLSEDERRAYIMADNRLAEKAGWDKEVPEIELQYLTNVGFDLELTGFEVPEVHLILDAATDREHDPGPEDIIPDLQQVAVSRLGDLWLLGPPGSNRHPPPQRRLPGSCERGETHGR